jgi:hypothetical protein
MTFDNNSKYSLNFAIHSGFPGNPDNHVERIQCQKKSTGSTAVPAGDYVV